MKTRIVTFLLALGVGMIVSGCVTNPALAVFDTGSQLQVRSHQTRAFDTADQEKILRTVIATLQDFGFVIDKADARLGSVSGTKLDSYEMRMTVTVRSRNEAQQLVRASAQFKAYSSADAVPVEDATPYREFFAALEKSMFLAAHDVD
jgi:2C-methyl-D-erythritol 2,4-cyclodiphosphate synthase